MGQPRSPWGTRRHSPTQLTANPEGFDHGAHGGHGEDLGGDKHEAQLTYLRLSGKRIGLFVNFNTILLTDGLGRRIL